VATEALAAAAQARDDAVHDHLTGLLNRRGWEQALDQEEARAARRPSAWVVAVVDIDHLKEANDRGGHLAGDVLLELAAGTIASSVRRNDVVARVGGDEFAVLGLDYAPHRPETLVGRIQRGLDDAGVSASVGAAVHDASVTLRETFHLADSAMYATKAARKGRLSST
jgi:diguanylate cyclase (GGDEF)-like protein